VDFDDDDDAHPCGCDRAYVCSDRFSWLAFRQPPFTATALLPPILFEFTRFHRAAVRRSKSPNLNFRSLTQSQSGPNVTSSIVALHRQNSYWRANCAQAEPMKRHDLSTI
jgi:hypothetical protein